MFYLHLHVATFDALLFWAPWRKAEDRTKLTPGAKLMFQLWISWLGWEEMGGNVLLQQIPGMLVAIFIIHCGLSLTEATPNFFLRQEYRHQLMHGAKLTLFPPERPLDKQVDFSLGRVMVAHSQTWQPPQSFGSSSGMVRQSCGHHLSQVEVVPHSAVRTVLGGAFWGGEFMSLLCAIGLSCPTASRAPSEGVSLLLPVGIVTAIRVFRIHRFKPASERLVWFVFSCLWTPSQ